MTGSGEEFSMKRGKNVVVDLFRGLNPRQVEAVKIVDKPLLVLAGAGSGKTRVLTQKIVHLIINKQYNANSILAMTFTNKAATEMKNRVSRTLGMSVDGLWIGTFHSIFARILRSNAKLLGYNHNFSIYDRDDSLNVIKQSLKQIPSGEKLDARYFLAQISKIKNALLLPADVQNIAHLEDDFKLIYTRYEESLKESNAMDFDDLLIKPLKLFLENANVLERYRKQFRYILIDEYQDTNMVQFQLAKILTEPHGNLCVVGDEDQAIYGWRGANIENILSFENTFPNAVTVRLEQNYRSFSAILNVANSVVNQNRKRLGKNIFSERGEGSKPVIIECKTGRQEAGKVFEIISQMIKNESYKPGEIAVLYRTNAHSRQLEDSLRNQGISYEIIGGTKFYDRKEIKDALSYLRLMVNPNDVQAFVRCISTPKRGIGSKTVEKILKNPGAAGQSIITSLQLLVDEGVFSQNSKNKIIEFISILQLATEKNGKENPAIWAEQFFKDAGLISFYEKVDIQELVDSNSGDKAPRVDNIYDLVETIKEFALRQGNEKIGIEAFLQEIQLQTDIDEWNESKQKVTLMTIHQSKGLEFPVVIIAGLEQGLLPLSRNFDEPDDLEEERRLFYVASTRAEDKLFMTYAIERFRYGKTIYSFPSQFLDEISPEFVDIQKEKRGTGGDNYRSRKNRLESIEGEPYYDYDDIHNDEDSRFSIGMEVNHPTFGDGKIINVEGFGNNSKITVMFYNGYFSKKLVKKYAKLQIISV